MQVSLNWLKRYVDLKESPAQLSAILTTLGFEVEALKILGEGITGVVVGEVKAQEKHPEADKLSVCKVFDGLEELPVVCGAPNVAAGQKVLFARVGAKLPGLTIKRAKLRGQESFGMICAEDELGLGESHAGILILPPESVPGTPLDQIPGLCDALLEVNVTPNRPDALCHLGLARELAAKLERPLRLPHEHLHVASVARSEIEKQSGGMLAGECVKLTVEEGIACSRYVGRVIEGIKVGESPAWLKTALKAVGKASINNVVDLTNFVLLEWGQPSHAFDLDTLSHQAVVIRRARPEESLTTLDGIVRKLTPEDLVIADGEKAQVLAGVMGGVASGVSPETHRIFLEVAYFQPAFVRKQAKRHGLSTDSSYRFERGIDPLQTAEVADYLAALIAHWCGGWVLPGRVEFQSEQHPIQTRAVALRPDRLKKVLGVTVGEPEIQKALSSIGLKFQGETRWLDQSAMNFAIPGFRGDLEREVDLIEEIARLMDYNTIPAVIPSFPLALGSVPPRESLAREIRHTLRDLGLREILSLRFTSRKSLLKLGLSAEDARLFPVLLRNPLSSDWEALPTTGLPALLQAIRVNQSTQQESLRFFEIGKTFFPCPKIESRDSGVVEADILTLGLSGLVGLSGWNQEESAVDFAFIRGVLENLMTKLRYPIEITSGSPQPFLHPKESATLFGITPKGERFLLGHVGKLHPRAVSEFELRGAIVIAEISLTQLGKIPKLPLRFETYSTQSAVERDFNAVVEESMLHSEIEKRIVEQRHLLVKGLRLNSIYRGQGVGEGHKAMHYSVVYRHGERTLVDEEVNAAHEALKAALSQDGKIQFK